MTPWRRSFVIGAALVVLVLSTDIALADADRCPRLPVNYGYSWVYQQGPDFDLCYAMPARDDQGFFGLYLGYFPNFDPMEGKPIESGMVGEQAVFWYEAKPDRSAYQLARQTLFTLPAVNNQPPLVVHLWVHAQSDREMARLLKLLGTLRFGPER